MNENTEFNFEWAKCWGVFTDEEKIWMYRLIDAQPLGIDNDLIIYYVALNSPHPIVQSSLASNFSMATRAECEVAGVDYIEPHVSAEELAELHKDKARLDFIVSCRGDNGHFTDTYMGGGKVRLGGGDWHKTPREAIDAAMKGGE